MFDLDLCTTNQEKKHSKMDHHGQEHKGRKCSCSDRSQRSSKILCSCNHNPVDVYEFL